jgi:hypothetical protein
MIRAGFSLALCAFLFCSVAAAQSMPDTVEPVLGQDLFKAFNGQTMDGIYKGARETSGTNKFTETFNTDGSTIYKEGPIKDKGRWAVTGKSVCFRYLGPLAGGISCFRVFKSGTCYYSYAPGNVIGDRPIDTNLWSVKTILRGDVSTCDNLVS